MKNVNNKLVNTKIMKPAEIDVFKPAVLLKFNVGAEERKFVELGAPPYKWVKMPMVPGLSDANFRGEERFPKPIPSKVKKTIVKFSDESLWPPLGKILAVDIFNGNNDRFDTENGNWQNYGNVMFLEGGDTKVIGLDTFDPNSQSANLNAAPIPGSLAPLRALGDSVQRLAFARSCTESVGKTLARNLGGCASVTIAIQCYEGQVNLTFTKAEIEKLFVQHAPLLAAGIQKGADQLKTYLQNKFRHYRQQFPPERLPPEPPPQERLRSKRLVPVVPANLPPPQPLQPVKPRNIPQGVWDRMVFLAWQV